MTLRWLLAAVHLIALGVGMGAVFARGLALRKPETKGSLDRAFLADSYWGLSAILWIGTGLWRLFGEYEKTLGYYLDSSMFWVKMGLLAGILLLELWPMVVLIQWRFAVRAKETIDLSPAPKIARISYLQTAILVVMVLAATAMARGFDF